MYRLKDILWDLSLAAIIFAAICFITSCEKPDPYDLDSLPADTGGLHLHYCLNETEAPYGYHVYLPSGYDNTENKYPLLVFLHGGGARGNSAENPEDLDLVLGSGPPAMIESGEWSSPWPMIVVSPQTHEGTFNPETVHRFISWVLSEYRINERRIYLTGFSMGGYGTFKYLQAYSNEGYVAAAVPMCGAGDTTQANRLVNIPLWVFHGNYDTVVLTHHSIDMVRSINHLNPQLRAKLTIYPGVGHECWTRTYNGSGMGTESPDYDPFNMSIYEWMFLYSK